MVIISSSLAERQSNYRDPIDPFRALPGFHETGENQYQARCPAAGHDDRVASLSIGIGDDGRALLHCQAGCSTEEILAAMGLTMKDLFPSNGNGSGKRVEVATYDYRDIDGTLLYQVVRFSPKGFQQRRPDGDGWTWSVKGVKRVPYRVRELVAAHSIFITEGEKDADALHRIGLTGTCNAGGAGKWPDELDQYFRPEHEAIILPDNDEPGRKHAELVAGHLKGKVGSVKVLHLAGLPEKGDVSDWLRGRDPEGAAEELCKLADGAPEWEPPEPDPDPAPEPGDKVFDLNDFVLNADADAMEKQMLEDKFVLGRLARLGQSTVIYSKPNAGKTLLTLWMLIRAIERGDINGDDVFYINADDTHKGLVFKLKLARAHGFKMLAPGYRGFKAEHLPVYLRTLTDSGTARGKILVLDTTKKFTDLMKKDLVSAFAETVRQFVLHGGTVIMLAHVNKHRGEDGKLIYSGTTDLPDDADCAYTLDIVTEDPERLRTVMFECFKSRGDVAGKAVYRYDARDSISYRSRLDSVVEVGADELELVKAQRLQKEAFDKDREIVEAIIECIREQYQQKTGLVDEVHKRSGFSKRKIIAALSRHTGPDSSKSNSGGRRSGNTIPGFSS
jgi:hypothetical protein